MGGYRTFCGWHVHCPFLSFLVFVGWTTVAWAGAGPIINEIHYDAGIKTEWVEFIELANPSSEDIDLSGWALSRAVDFTFPPGAILAADGVVVVAQDVAALQSKFATSWLNPAGNFGPFQGRLNNQGESNPSANPLRGRQALRTTSKCSSQPSSHGGTLKVARNLRGRPVSGVSSTTM